MIWDVGGHAPITGEKLREQLVKQAMTFHPTVVLNEKLKRFGEERTGYLFYKHHPDNNMCRKRSLLQ